ncbi:MAG: hypothetical protein QOF00_3322 [Pseudonocardiales bacterium]|jgi:hypothetical protein|nr:hypothetical protein [Pseudonocardiales bacterium]
MPDVTTSSGVVRAGRRTPMGEDRLSADVLRRATDRVECDPRRARRQAWTGYANHR